VELNWSSLGGEAEPSTIGRAGVTLRPPMVAVRSIGGGIDLIVMTLLGDYDVC